MCLHGKHEIERAVRDYTGDNMYGALWWELDGEPRYGECVRFQDTQQVAQMIKNIKVWHDIDEAKSWVVNLTDVNAKRAAWGLPELTPAGLPVALDPAPASRDTDRPSA